MFDNIKLVVFDLDGTVYLGDKLIDGADSVITHIREKGRQVCFLTNNSTRTRLQIFNKLKNLGIQSEISEVFTAGYISAKYLKNMNINNVYVCGSDDLIKEFEEEGVSIEMNEEKAENLFIGYNALFDYEKLTRAFHVACKADKMIAANVDAAYPGKNGILYPGCGAMVAAIEYSANRKSDVLVGKPNTLMLKMIESQYQLSEDEILVVGDNYNSDILMAQANGSPSILIGESQKNVICVKDISQLIDMIY